MRGAGTKTRFSGKNTHKQKKLLFKIRMVFHSFFVSYIVYITTKSFFGLFCKISYNYDIA